MNPRRYLIVAALVAAPAVTPVGAQQLDGWGVTGGLNRATLAGGFMDLVRDRGGIVNPRYGFTVGGYASLALAPATSLRPELAITQRGARIPAENGVRRRDMNLTYLAAAAMARRAIPLGSVAGWVGAGPTLSLKLSAKGRIDDEDGIDFSDEVKGTDLGLAFEAGITRGQVDVGLRYLFGITNISTSSDPDEAAKNRGLGVVVSYGLKR